jgi:hypothetical protein
VLHAIIALGAHAPCPLHALVCQVPVVLHVSVSVPQLPQATGLV